MILTLIAGDGSIRVWKDYTQKDKHRLATSWQAVQGHRPGARSIDAVVDWQQITGSLVSQHTTGSAISSMNGGGTFDPCGLIYRIVSMITSEMVIDIKQVNLSG